MLSGVQGPTQGERANRGANLAGEFCRMPMFEHSVSPRRRSGRPWTIEARGGKHHLLELPVLAVGVRDSQIDLVVLEAGDCKRVTNRLCQSSTFRGVLIRTAR